jgi:hypothetical protein
VKIHGRVIKRPVAVGSKSEHDAILLVTDHGQYLLRRQGGNPFADPVLEKLVGKSIDGDGIVHGHTFIMSDWAERPENYS